MKQDLDTIRRFILGGLAIFTIVSKKSGARKTFRVRKAEDVTGEGRPHGYYVDLLTGPNNTSDYRYICYLWIDEVVGSLHSKINKQQWGADAVGAFGWFLTMINRHHDHFPDAQAVFERLAEFHHCGRCCVCGRTLTTPESVESGIGPICAGRQIDALPFAAPSVMGLSADPSSCAFCGKKIKKHTPTEIAECGRQLGVG